MGTWVKTHLGLLAILPLYFLIRTYPIHDGGMLPGPFETLFDWAGEFIAMTYISTVILMINFSPVVLVAGCLDRCSPIHTIPVLVALILYTFWHYHYQFPSMFALICALISSLLAGLLYLLIRFLKAQVARRLVPTS